MSRIQCRKCGYVSQRAIHCAHCGGDYTMCEVDEEKDDMRERIAELEAALREADDLIEDRVAARRQPRAAGYVKTWTNKAEKHITAARAVLEWKR